MYPGDYFTSAWTNVGEFYISTFTGEKTYLRVMARQDFIRLATKL